MFHLILAARRALRRRSYVWTILCFIGVLHCPTRLEATVSFQYKKVVDSTTQVPGETLKTKYRLFGRPAINQSQVAYRAGYLDTSNTWQQRVDRVTPGGSIILIEQASASGPVTQIISDPTIYGTEVAFSGRTSGSQETGAFYTIGSGLVTDGFDFQQAPTIYDGRVAYPRRSFTGGNNIHIATVQGSSAPIVRVDFSTPIPNESGHTFGQYDAYLDHNLNSSNTNGSIAFMGVWFPGTSSSNLPHGIYRWDEDTETVTTIADENVPIPGQAGTFDTPTGFAPFITDIAQFNSTVGNAFSFSSPPYTSSSFAVSSRPSLYGKTISFNYDDGPRAGVFQRTAGPVNAVADVNTPHPAIFGNFRDFFASTTAGGSTAFLATDASGEELGLFLTHCGKINTVAAEGELLDGKVVIDLELGHRGLAVKQGTAFTQGLELAFRAVFDDGSEGVYVASTSQLCISIGTTVSAGVGNTSTQRRGTVFGFPSATAPVFDDLNSSLQVEMIASAGAESAVFGGNADADLLGVDSLPGNDPLQIDFAMQSGEIVPEAIAMSFNEPLLIDGIQLVDFGPTDSALLSIGSQTVPIDGLTYSDGLISLPSVTLASTDKLRISWDSSNTTGDGFRLGDVLVSTVPEPGTVSLALVFCGTLLGYRRRTTPTISTF